jgi:hypothetical protein
MELFGRTQHPDSVINRIQDKLIRVINAIARKPIVDGHVVTADIATTETKVEHGLGRVPQGWIALTPSVLSIGQSRAADENFLYLLSTGAQPGQKFWVF